MKPLKWLQSEPRIFNLFLRLGIFIILLISLLTQLNLKINYLILALIIVPIFIFNSLITIIKAYQFWIIKKQICDYHLSSNTNFIIKKISFKELLVYLVAFAALSIAIFVLTIITTWMFFKSLTTWFKPVYWIWFALNIAIYIYQIYETILLSPIAPTQFANLVAFHFHLTGQHPLVKATPNQNQSQQINRLSQMNLAQLQYVAKQLQISSYQDFNRDDLLNLIVKIISYQQNQDHTNHGIQSS